MEFKGIIPAVITPMGKDGEINNSSLRQLVNWLIEQGADGLYICGSTSECFMLEDSERKSIVETIMEETNGRVPVVAHIGAIWAGKAVELARHAASCGVTAISSVPPFYYKFNFDEIAQYYKQISDAVDIPVILYNMPDFTGVTLNASNIRHILESCNVMGIKYTDYNLFEMERIRRAYPDLKVYNGHDECMLNALPLGITGSIGSTFNVMLKKFKKIESLFMQGELEKAVEVQHEANMIIDVLLSTELFPAIKYLLSRLGIDSGSCRKPFADLTDANKAVLETVLPLL